MQTQAGEGKRAEGAAVSRHSRGEAAEADDTLYLTAFRARPLLTRVGFWAASSSRSASSNSSVAGVMRALPVSLLVSLAAYMTGLVSPPIAAVMFVLMMVPAHMPTASITIHHTAPAPRKDRLLLSCRHIGLLHDGWRRWKQCRCRSAGWPASP